jgi:hypothetical protein
MQSSVLACWLDFGQAGLASLPTSAFVAHLQPDYNSKTRYLPISQKFTFHKCFAISMLQKSQNLRTDSMAEH